MKRSSGRSLLTWGLLKVNSFFFPFISVHCCCILVNPPLWQLRTLLLCCHCCSFHWVATLNKHRKYLQILVMKAYSFVFCKRKRMQQISFPVGIKKKTLCFGEFSAGLFKAVEHFWQGKSPLVPHLSGQPADGDFPCTGRSLFLDPDVLSCLEKFSLILEKES